MRKRFIAPSAFGLLALAGALSIAHPAVTLKADDASDNAEFILCAPEDRVAAIASRHSLTVVRPADEHRHGVFLVRGPVPSQQPDAVRGDTLDALAQQLVNDVRSDPDVEHFDFNGAAVIAETGSRPQLDESTVEILDSLERTLTGYFGNSVWTGYVSQPALGILQLPQGQQLADGTGVVVAVIDTGVDPHHPALADVLVGGYDFTRDVEGPASEWADLSESTVEILDSASVSVVDPSTSVAVNASTLALVDTATASRLDLSRLPEAFGHGTMVAGLVHVVAPGAKIMPLKAFKADGTSNSFDIQRAIYYAVEHGAKAINMSFSSASPSASLTEALDYATAHGVICVASAGNSGRSAVVFPAGYRNVMAIGSTSLSDERSPFTNFGDHLVKFAAPGEGLITLYPGRRYAAVSGTSFSAALATGAAGLLSQRRPAMDQRLASRYLEDGAVRRAGWELGDGRLNLYASLLAQTPTNTRASDTTAPVVTLTNPLAAAVVAGTLQLKATASDDIGVGGVRFTLDGVLVADVVASASSGDDDRQDQDRSDRGDAGALFAMNWDSRTTTDGVHLLAVVARDAAGNQSTTSVRITVANDGRAPKVALTQPESGAAVSGPITLGATASDQVGVTGVQFTVDGVPLGDEVSLAPYQIIWDTASVANGVHVIGVIARDAAGNQRRASISVLVANDTIPPPAEEETNPVEV